MVTTVVSGSASFFIPTSALPQSTASVEAVQATTVVTSARPTQSVVTITENGQETTSTSSFDAVTVFTTIQPAASQIVETTVYNSAVVQVPQYVTVTVQGGQTSVSSTMVESTRTYSTVISTAVVANNAATGVEAATTILSIGTSSNVVTVTVGGVESISTSVGPVYQTVTVPAAGVSNISSAEAAGTTASADVLTNSSVVTQTIPSALPVETVITVTLGNQVLTSTVSTAAAVQTPVTTVAPQVSTVYVTIGSGATASVLTNTITASEVVAQDTVTLVSTLLQGM